jgi:glycosyltransferase involved in cell wall biosynthesis
MPAESHGGVPFSTYNLAKSLKELGNEVVVITTDRNGSGRLPCETGKWISFQEIPVFYFETFNGPYVILKGSLGCLREQILNSDVTISSSTLWNHLGFVAAFYAKKYKKCHLVYPRGLLDSWALKHKKYRKYLFLYTQVSYVLRNCNLVVALSEAERRSILSIFPGVVVTVIPNGANLNADHPASYSNSPLESPLDFIPASYLLFLGRISEKKGLSQAIQAFNSSRVVRDVVFVIVGPVDKYYRDEFEHIISEVDPERLVVLPPQSGKAKEFLLSNALGFILTSVSEGMPMAALEALSYGVPAILTPECNIPEVAKYNAGWLVEIGDIANTSRHIDSLYMDRNLRCLMSSNAIELVKNKFDWKVIALKTESSIRELL